jgi:hypothetical protein
VRFALVKQIKEECAFVQIDAAALKLGSQACCRAKVIEQFAGVVRRNRHACECHDATTDPA